MADTDSIVRPELVLIPGGEFVMGSTNSFFAEAPPRRVSVAAFFLGKYPVTQSQWMAVMGDNPSHFRDSPDRPVDSVSWEDAVRFCERLSERSGSQYRLPAEAEWEYACRAGTTGDYFFSGHDDQFNDASEIPWAVKETLCNHSWFELNSMDKTWPVGLKAPNPWGLHDMTGNVWEWCLDDWHGSYAGAPATADPWVAAEGRSELRCLRGGAWNMDAFRCRSSYRTYEQATVRTHRFGFRLAASQ